MSVYRRSKSEVWYFDLIRKGKRYSGTTGQTNKTKARDYVRTQVLALIDAGTWHSKHAGAGQTFAEYVKRVLEIVDMRNGDKPRTIKFYKETFDAICRNQKFADTPLAQINDEALTDYTLAAKGERKRAPLQNSTINRRLACIRKLLRVAQKEKVLGVIPEVVMLPGERTREFVMTPAQRDLFLLGLNEPYQSFARFLFETGLRISEACGLRKSDVYFDQEPYLRVVKANSKGKRERHVPLSQIAQDVIRRQLVISQSDYIFVKYGPHIRSQQYRYPLSRHEIAHKFLNRKRELIERGFKEFDRWDCVMHGARHTFLTEVGMAGADLFTIMTLGGHRDAATAQRYVHPVSESLRRAVERRGVMQELQAGVLDGVMVRK